MLSRCRAKGPLNHLRGTSEAPLEPPAPPPVIAPLRLTPAPPEKGGAAENKGTPREKASPREKGTPRGLDRAKMANEVAAEMRCPLTGRHAAPKD